MTQLLTLLAFVMLAGYLWSAVRSKEIAIRVGAATCQKHGLQFLDETVEQQLLRFRLDPRGNPAWYREFHFEFATDGEFRYGGMIKMYGHRIHAVVLDPYPEFGQHTPEQLN